MNTVTGQRFMYSVVKLLMHNSSWNCSHGTSCKSTAAVINTHSAHKGVSFAEVRVDISTLAVV